jgi:hypothetical protein
VIPIALLFFKLGVEIGQLVFVAAVLTAGGLLRRAIALSALEDGVSFQIAHRSILYRLQETKRAF